MKKLVILLLVAMAIIEVQFWYQNTQLQILRMDTAVAEGDIHRLDRMTDLKFERKR